MTLTRDEAATVALRELDGFTARLGELDPTGWRRPTRCAGWDVTALARHVAGAAWQQAEAFHRARQDITEPPSVVGVSHEPDGLVAALARSRGHLEQGLSRLAGDRDPTVPLPFATLPASVATLVLVIEYGFHLNDLEWALGEETELRTDVAQTMVELLGIWLPSLQGDEPDGPVGYRLAGDGGVVTDLAWREGQWQVGQDAGPDTCEVTGSDSAVALFSMGRIGADHPWVTSRDPAGVAGRFKDFFPGP